MAVTETEIGKLADPVERLAAFIRARERLRLDKEAAEREGKAGYAVADPILKEFRFCNVRREDDRVTRWITDNWRTPHKDDPDLWFAMVVARFINWPPTLSHIGYPVPWSAKGFLEDMAELKHRGKKLYTGAYMVRADREHKDKFVYQEKVVFTPMWERRDVIRPKEGEDLNSYHMRLGMFHGLGSFMAAQVVADLKYVEPLRQAKDWWTFAASGPGSRRGLNRVIGLHKDDPWKEDDWRLALARLRERSSVFRDNLHAQDLQNCLCEFDKYERARLGEGKPRARYTSHA